MYMHFESVPYSRPRVIEGISITAYGRIGFPPYFLKTHSISGRMRAHLYWDAGNRAIAIGCTDVDDPEAWPITFRSNYGAFINARRFFRANRLDPGNLKGRYSYQQVSGESAGVPQAAELFVISLADSAEHGK